MSKEGELESSWGRSKNSFTGDVSFERQCGIVTKSTASEARVSTSQIQYLPAMCLNVSYLISPGLTLPICKMIHRVL